MKAFLKNCNVKMQKYYTTREGKVARINRQPFFSSISCCLPSLVKRVRNQAGQTTADSGKNWLSINSLCLTLASTCN